MLKELFLFSFLPQFDAVDTVLPKDIAAGTDRGEGVEIGVSYPDGESGVFLSKGLTCLDCPVEEMTHITAHRKLDDTKNQRQECDEQKECGRSVGMDNVFYSGARDNRQRHRPHIKREVFDTDDPSVETVEMKFDHIRQPHRQDQHQAHLI